MSIFKSNKFFRIIKHFILALPLMFVLGTSLYAIVNPNAKDSYYGESINEEVLTELVNKKDISSGTPIIMFGARVDEAVSIASSLSSIYCSSFTYDNVTYENVRFYFYAVNTSTSVYSYLRDSVDNLIFSDLLITNKTFEFVSYGNTFNDTAFDALSPMMKLISYNQYSYLNNAFEYGMYEFNQVGFGQFDFISLFNGIFTTNINNVYASFINDYINYYLFVEVIYFAPWVFHAFIHFAYDLGDYFTSSFKRNRKDDD